MVVMMVMVVVVVVVMMMVMMVDEMVVTTVVVMATMVVVKIRTKARSGRRSRHLRVVILHVGHRRRNRAARRARSCSIVRNTITESKLLTISALLPPVDGIHIPEIENLNINSCCQCTINNTKI